MATGNNKKKLKDFFIDIDEIIDYYGIKIIETFNNDDIVNYIGTHEIMDEIDIDDIIDYLSNQILSQDNKKDLKELLSYSDYYRVELPCDNLQDVQKLEWCKENWDTIPLY